MQECEVNAILEFTRDCSWWNIRKLTTHVINWQSPLSQTCFEVSCIAVLGCAVLSHAVVPSTSTKSSNASPPMLQTIAYMHACICESHVSDVWMHKLALYDPTCMLATTAVLPANTCDATYAEAGPRSSLRHTRSSLRHKHFPQAMTRSTSNRNIPQPMKHPRSNDHIAQ